MNLIFTLKEYLQQNTNIIFSYLFGSYARGDFNSFSDIDVAVYLKNQNISIGDYKKIRQELMDLTQKDVDLVILNEATPLVKHLVIQEKILIFSKSKDIEREFIVKALFEYNDMKPYLDLAYKNMIHRVRRELEDGN
ncbi:type VII toxin-antitoxin system MntA family adenylyltransferase antitoxin [Alkaliphilus hydrothermalis]|uniref:Nucleotidyltransferase n=1 Tax=Alkaliphilus hydrothermalis TaxID=1482730 RepID=A0ABS2NNN6_9FIRM|nr:nucleotidyltransferase domain-containing protein [Alkaliphilus hydrothermalis]MBM7614545.1 putative nucleotidyltransferase [Alkaliphilus hydrothermalis]